MMQPVTLWEACAGSAALALSLFGAAPPAPYRGGKRRYCDALIGALGLPTYAGPMFPINARVILSEPGTWGKAWQCVAEGLLEPAAEIVDGWADVGRPLFQRLSSAPPPGDRAAWLAAFLALQTGAALSKPVVEAEGRWKISGYGSLSPAAVAKGFRERLLPSTLAQRMRAIPQDFVAGLTVHHGPAQTADFGVQPTHVLIDPPYAETSGYNDVFERGQVVELALRERARGATVGVCEHGPIPELVAEGFEAVALAEQSVSFGVRSASRSTTEVLTLWRQ